MKKPLFFLLALLMSTLSWQAQAQINYSYDWEASGMDGWTSSGSGSFSRNTSNPCNGSASARANNYYGNSSYLVTPVLTGTNAGDLAVDFSYKVTKYSSPTTGVTLADFGTLKLQWGTSTSGPWVDGYVIDNTNHVVSGTCAVKSISISGLPAAGDVYLRFMATSGNSNADNYVYIDDVTINQGPPPACVAPSALTATPTSFTTADISWIASISSPSGYEYLVSSSNTPPVSGTATTSTSVTGVTIETAVENYLHVRSNCDGDGYSDWATYAFMGPTPGQIGTVEYSSTLPINSCYAYSYSQQLYFADELIVSLDGSGTYISKLRFYYDGGASGFSSSNVWNIYMANTTVASFEDKSSWVPSTELIEVFNGTVVLPAAGNWMEIRLTTGFMWDGTSNLVIAVDENTSSYNCTANFGIFDDASETARTLLHYSDSVNADPTAPPTAGYRYSSVNTIQLEAGTPPSCLAPTSLATTSVTPNSADIAWLAGDSETSWNVIWGSPNFIPGDGDEIGTDTANSASYQITGLMANTAYEFYVQADCGSGDESDWAGPMSFRTACDVITSLPYTENMDTYGTGSDAFPACWSRITYTSGTVWPSIVAHSSAPSSPNSLKFQSAVGTPTYAISPPFGADIHTLQVSFMLRREGTSSGTIDVGVMSDPLDDSTFELVQTIDPSNTSDYLPYEFNLNTTTLSGGNNHIALRHNSGASYYYYWMDDFTVQPIPSCPKPSDLLVDAVTTTADVSWTAGNTETEWNISWGLPDYTPGTDDLGTDSSNTESYQITGLVTNTAYEFYVQAFCGVGDESNWSGPVSFTTLALPPSNDEACGATVLACGDSIEQSLLGATQSMEDDCFGSGTADVWFSFTSDGSQLLTVAETSSLDAVVQLFVGNDCGALEEAGACQDSPEKYTVSQAGTYYFRVRPYSSSNNEGDITVELTCVTPAAGDSCDLAIALDCNAEPATYSSVNSVASAPSGCSMGDNGIWFSFVGTGGDITVNSTATFDHKLSVNIGECGSLTNLACQDSSTGAENYTITASVANQTYYVYVAHYSSYTSSTGDITISIDCATPPTCFAPSALAVDNITAHGADVSWTAGDAETAWEVLYGAPNFDVENDGFSVDVTSTATTLESLDSNTSYDVYVRAICDVNDQSDWTGPVSFTTTLESGYCAVNFPSAVEPITYVNFGAIDNTTDAAVDGSPALEEFTSQIASVEQNGNYPIEIKGNTGGNFTSRIVVYVDWNQDGVFDDSVDSNEMYLLPNIVNSTGVDGIKSEGMIEVPRTALLGNTGMRVMKKFSSIPTPCNTTGYGQAEDYTISVSAISGYVYENGAWTPGNPSGVSTSTDNITVINGTASLTADTDVNNIMINSGATLEIHNVLHLNGDLTNDGDLVFVSTATGNGELAEVPVTSTISGDITVQQYMKNRRSYRMVSSPVFTTTSIHANWQEGATSSTDNPAPGFGTHITGSTSGADGFDATATGNVSMFTVDIAAQQFVAVSNTDVDGLVPGEGYLLFVRGDRSIDLSDNNASSETVLRAKGMLATGPGTLSYATMNAGDNAMFGNPYQSTVDINSVFANAGTTNINTSHYFVYDPTLADNGAYTTVTLPAGSSTGGSAANQYLQPGQGAQFATAGAGASSLEFKETNKAPGNFTSTSRPLTANDMLTVQLYTTENFRNGGPTHDSFGIIFGDGLNNELTLIDAVKPMNFYENLGVDHNGTYLSIEQREMPEVGEVYALYSAGYQHADYTLKLIVDGLDTSFLYLEDSLTGTSTLLEAGENVYSFAVDANNPMSIATDRFTIRTAQRLGVNDNNVLSGIRLFPNPLNGDTFYINAPKLNGEQLSVSITDLTGRSIYEQTLDCHANKVTVPMGNNVASGVYLVTLKNGEDSQTYRLIKE